MAKSKITPAHATAVATTNRLGAAALSVNEAALPHEEWVAENPLSKAVRSDFEELEERRRTVNLKACWRRPGKKMVGARRGAERQARGGSAPSSRAPSRGGREVVLCFFCATGESRRGPRVPDLSALAFRRARGGRKGQQGCVGCVCGRRLIFAPTRCDLGAI